MSKGWGNQSHRIPDLLDPAEEVLWRLGELSPVAVAFTCPGGPMALYTVLLGLPTGRPGIFETRGELTIAAARSFSYVTVGTAARVFGLSLRWAPEHLAPRRNMTVEVETEAEHDERLQKENP